VTGRAPRRLRGWEAAALLVVLGVAGGLRLGWPGVVELRRDEASVSRLALDMARGEDVPLLGIGSSTGIPNGPFSVWVMVPPFLVSPDAEFATAYVAFLNVLAVLLLWFFVRRHWGRGAALLAALCLAAGPWPVIFSRKIWAQDVLPLFATAVVATGVLGFLEDRRWARFLHLPLLSITGQIHYAAIALVPTTVYLVAAGRRRLGRPFWTGLLVAVLLVVPFAIGAWRALEPVLWRVPGAIEEHRAERSLALSAEPWDLARRITGGEGLPAYVGGERAEAVAERAPPVEGLYAAFGVVVLAAGAWVVVRAFGRGRRVERALALWVLSAPLLYTVTWNYVHIHYLIPMLPAAFAALGVAGRDLGAVLGRRVRVAGVAALLVVAGLQAWTTIACLGYAREHATPGAFGVPLERLEAVRDAVLAKRPRQVLARLDGQVVGLDSDATVWDFLLDAVPTVRFLPDGVDVFPATDAALLERACAGDGRVFPMRVDEATGEPERCYVVGERAGGAPELAPVEAPAFEAGAQVVGVGRTSAGLAVAWRLEGPARGPANDAFRVAYDLLDPKGDVVAHGDAPFWLGRYWRAGDVVVLTLPDAPTARRLRLGLYSEEESADGVRVHHSRAAGAEGVELDLSELTRR